ncbi:MAG: Outer membrane protein precursor [Syntrophus sp. PtaU1.Bin208]|nr:MAG: Outer membrane protein precursor [Syntrophus sp. PtaU1.Bin208]
MARILLRFLIALCIVALLTACTAKRSMIVLLPDQDGKTGAIEVQNQGGSLKLDAPNQATEILSAQTPPAPPIVLSEEEIKKRFAETLAATPGAPVHYVLYFLSDSKELTEESKTRLDEVVLSINRIHPAEIAIVGHTDRVGDRKRNFRLGLDRATQVKHLLITRGVDPGMVEVSSHGEDNPLIKTADEVSEPENRRVEIVLR